MPPDEKNARLKNVKRPRYGKRKPKCSRRQPKLKTRMHARRNRQKRADARAEDLQASNVGVPRLSDVDFV